MTPAERLVLASPTDDLDTTLAKLAERDIEQIPVVSGGQIVGMLDRRDVARWIEIQMSPASALERAHAR